MYFKIENNKKKCITVQDVNMDNSMCGEGWMDIKILRDFFFF